MSSDFHNFLVQSLNERIEFNKLMKLRKEFQNVLDTLKPVEKFGVKFFYSGNGEVKSEINFYSELHLQIFFPYIIKDHIQQVTEFVFELLVKKYEVRNLSYLYRVVLGEDFDIDVLVGKSEDEKNEYALLIDLEKNLRHTGKLLDFVNKAQHARSILKIIRLWKKHKLLNWDSIALEKSEMGFAIKNASNKNYGEVFESWLKNTLVEKSKPPSSNINKKIILAVEESLLAIQDKFWMKVLY